LRLDKLGKEIAAKTGRNAEAIPADLTVKNDLWRIEERLRSDDHITALVNNAGFGGAAKLIDSNVEEMDNMIQLNVVALTRLTSAVLSGFIKRSNGVIINILSVVALSPELKTECIAAPRLFVVNLTQSLHNEVEVEVKDNGVLVQAVLPGAVRTQFWDNAKMPVQSLPKEIVMTAEQLVDASLAGLDQGELITIPSLPQ